MSKFELPLPMMMLPIRFQVNTDPLLFMTIYSRSRFLTMAQIQFSLNRISAQKFIIHLKFTRECWIRLVYIQFTWLQQMFVYVHSLKLQESML